MTETNPLPPVFVDATGRRGRRMRRVGYLFGTASLVYTGLVGAGFTGGPSGTEALLPLPDLLDRPEAAPATPAPATATPAPHASKPATDTSVAVDKAVPVPTGTPLPASAPAARAVLAALTGSGPAAVRPLESGAVIPAAGSSSAPAGGPTRPVDATEPSEQDQPAEPMAAEPDPTAEPSPTATPAPAATADGTSDGLAGSVTADPAGASAPAPRDGRRPSPRPSASR